MKKIYILVLAALAMAVSCNKTALVEDYSASERVVHKFTFNIATPDSKVAIDDATGKTRWEENDEIMIRGRWTGKSGDKIYSRVITLTSENILNEGKTASFEVEEIVSTSSGNQWKKGKTTLFAMYPASTVVINNGSGNLNENTPFNTTSAPLMMGYNNVDVNGGNTFTMYNLCGILSFKVSGDYDTYIFEGNNGEAVSYDGYIATMYMGSDGSPVLSYKTGGAPLTSVSGPVTSDGSTINYVYIPEGASFTKGFTIKLKKSGVILKTLSTTKEVIVGRNEYRPMGDVTSYLKTYVAPSISDHTYDSEVFTSVTNLGETKTANCYVISAAGSYKIPVVKGNSSTSAGNIFGVQLLWETWNNSETVTPNSVIAAVDFDGPSNFIYFKTPATLRPGNALIAAKDNLGKIIWSWHIWVPATVPGSDAYVTSDSSKKMLDRNIGALHAPQKDTQNPEDAGLFYQWGRKDPLRTISNYADGTKANTCPKDVWQESSTQLTTDNMHESPCVFIKGNNDWLSTRENSLWTDSKTINDPCPAGYKVPQYGYTSFFDYFTIGNYLGWSFNEEQYNYTIGLTADPVAVFPFGHITKYGEYDLTDSKAWIWTASYKSDNTENARAVTVASSTSNSCTGQRKANGVYVRCVAE